MKTLVTLIAVFSVFQHADAYGAETRVESKPSFYVVEETTFFNPSAVLAVYEKSAAEMLPQYNAIIGVGDELKPSGRTIGEIIKADLEITEASLPTSVPLTITTTVNGFERTTILN